VLCRSRTWAVLFAVSMLFNPACSTLSEQAPPGPLPLGTMIWFFAPEISSGNYAYYITGNGYDMGAGFQTPRIPEYDGYPNRPSTVSSDRVAYGHRIPLADGYTYVVDVIREDPAIYYGTASFPHNHHESHLIY
jgi:hypothetical protein